MEEKNLPFQYADKQAVNELLEQMNLFLKDCDAAEEKAMVKDFLKKASSLFEFVVIGDSAVGKTTLLKRLFGEELIETVVPTTEITEYRYGEEAGKFQMNEVITRVFCPLDEIRGISVVDMPGINRMNQTAQTEAMLQAVTKSDVLLVVFPADTVTSFGIWDILEKTDVRKMVFVLTKTDTCPAETVEQSRNRLREYMMDAGIEAPIFASESLEELKEHINQRIIGTSPELKKQRENVLELKAMLDEVNRSFALRKKQYEADLAVVEKINTSMDGFLMESQEKIDDFKNHLKNVIDFEINEYENEIIDKLNPRQIKERYEDYTDFVEDLNIVNEGYQRKMQENVNRQTQKAICGYLSELENVFDQATGYFRERESLLTLEDKFYGSIAEGKKQMVSKAGTELQEARVYYEKLGDASVELFWKLWKEREEYDRKVKAAHTLGGVTGGVVGGVGGVLGLGVLALPEGTALTVTAALQAGIGALAGPALLVPLVVGAGACILAGNLAKDWSSGKNGQEMERHAQEAIRDFQLEIGRTKEEMTVRILEMIDAIFKREIDSADKTFLDFRMSVNIDAKNIPLLEERMEKVNALMDRIEEIEKERLLA